MVRLELYGLCFLYLLTATCPTRITRMSNEHRLSHYHAANNQTWFIRRMDGVCYRTKNLYLKRARYYIVTLAITPDWKNP